MKSIFLLLVPALVAFAPPALAQDARTLIKAGVELSNAGNYAGAIAKYKTALAAEPDNASANYQLAFALNATGKGPEAIPHLQKVVAQNNMSAKMLSSAYSLLGGIYDKAGKAKQSIENYQQAIKVDTGDALLRYNLGLAQFRNKQFADAEKSAVAALTIDPTHAASMRLYALVTFHQNKRAPALLALCTFLWMTPNEAHAAEAYGNLQSILKGGTLKAEPGAAPLDAENKVLNQAITAAVEAVAKRRYLMAVDPLTEQLQAIYASLGQLAEKQKGNEYFRQLAGRYYKLSQTRHVPAFAQYIRQSPDKGGADWVRLHPQQVTALQEWMKDFLVQP